MAFINAPTPNLFSVTYLAPHSAFMTQVGLKRRPRQNALFRQHLRTMPRGFSCAVHVAHEIAARLLRECLEKAALKTSFEGRILPLSKNSHHLSVRSGDIVVGHIIDDVCLVGYGTSSSMLLAAQSSIWSSFSKHGLPVRISKSTPVGVLRTDNVTFIGFMWDFLTGLICPKDDRCESAAALRHQSDKSFEELDEKSLQSLVGKIVWLSVARRPLLSLFRCAVLPCAVDVPSARRTPAREIRQFGLLARLAFIDTHRKMSTLVLCTDASEHGGSLVVSRASRDEIDSLLSKAWYNGGELPRDANEVRHFVNRRPWRVILSYRWAFPEHINLLEAAAVLVAYRWYASNQPNNMHVLLLPDSFVVLGTLATGRSSSCGLMRYARHIAAVLLARGIDLITVHVPTDCNPADGPSRALYPTGYIEWPSALASHSLQAPASH